MTVQLESLQIATQSSSLHQIYEILKMVDVLLAKYETMPYVDSPLWNGNDDQFDTLLNRTEKLVDLMVKELDSRMIKVKFTRPDAFTPSTISTMVESDSESGTSRNQRISPSPEKKQRRSGPRPNHPAWVRKILKDWYNLNKDYAYPQADEKKQLADRTYLTVQQVTNWFVNGGF
jgi:predicted aminopeptidase